jgi:hypothetical protein
MSWIDQYSIVKLEEFFMQTIVEEARHLPRGVAARSHKIRTADIADEESIARQYALRLGGDLIVDHKDRNAFRRMARSFNDP